MGAAVGVFVSFTPFLGFHLLITFALAWLLGANMIAGAIATSIGNPLTFPFIWASTYQVGHFDPGGREPAAAGAARTRAHCTGRFGESCR